MRTSTLGSRSSFWAPNLARALTAAGGKRDDSVHQETETRLIKHQHWWSCATCTDCFTLQHHPVENEADVLGRLGGARALLAQQMQNLDGQHRVFAVLDELAQMSQTCLLALRILLNDADDTVHDGALILKTTLQEGNRVERTRHIAGEEATKSDLHHLWACWTRSSSWRCASGDISDKERWWPAPPPPEDIRHIQFDRRQVRKGSTKQSKQARGGSDLELIRDLRNKRRDLLHESVHAALAARLEQGGDGQCGDAAVGVCDQVLQVQVARSHRWWVLHGHLVDVIKITGLFFASCLQLVFLFLNNKFTEDYSLQKEQCLVKLYLVESSDCSISQSCFGGTAEKLQHCRTTTHSE